MFRWLKNIVEPNPRGRVVHKPLRVRGRYDAASTSDENRRHWANADLLAADTANSAQVRRILRSRARYEVANNSYARGIVNTLANDCVGTGPRLQLLTDDAEANRLVEQEFSLWAEAINLAERLRTMRVARAQDGEVFAILVANPRIESPVKLDLRLVEADQVATPQVAQAANAVDGIVFDAYGNPVEYHVLKNHPGGVLGQWSLDYDRIPAAAMLHYFRTDRPGQSRGIPEITPAFRHGRQGARARWRLPARTLQAASHHGPGSGEDQGAPAPAVGGKRAIRRRDHGHETRD
ncbi:MAG: phage portal protein [Pirellulales bacterium]